MEITNSPVADWSKEEQYNNWFSQFDEIDGDFDFEVIDSNEVDNKLQGTGETAPGDDD